MNLSTPTLRATPENRQRIEVEARIIRRLQRIDVDLLWQLDEVTRRAETISRGATGDATEQAHRSEISPATPEQTASGASGLTRRQALLKLATGGAALTVAGVLAVRSRDTELGADPTEARVQNDQLQTLVALYEMLDRIELDRLIAVALVVVGASLQGLRTASRGLQSAVEFVDGLLDRFEEAAPRIAAGIDAVEDVVQVLADQVDRLRDLFADVLDEAAPLTQAVDRFVERILSYLPFGIGDRIRQTVEQMGALVALVPNGVSVVRDQLLAPIRAWFPATDGNADRNADGNADEDVRAALFASTRRELLQPARTLLGDVIDFADRWETELAGPIEQALAQRAEVRQQIAEYKQRVDLT